MTILAALITAVGVLMILVAFISVFAIVQAAADDEFGIAAFILVVFVMSTTVSLWLLNNADKF